MDSVQIPTWITICGIEWVASAEVVTKACDCFMQQK